MSGENLLTRWVLFGLLILPSLLLSCKTSTLLPIPTSTPWPTASFTYSTYDGGIWQIDLDGNRFRLMASDDMLKWHLKWSDDHQWLAYIGLEYPEPEVRTETLFVMDREGENIKELAGPHRSIYYEWDDTRRIRLGVADLLTPDRPQGRDWFRADIETDTVIKIEIEEWLRPTPLPEPRLIEAPNGQWVVQSKEEGSRRFFYLLDTNGNQISLIYEQPVNIGEEFTMWSKNSQWFIYMPLSDDNSYYGDLYLYHPASLSSKRLTTYEEEQGRPARMGGFKWSPNGEWLLFDLADSVTANQLCVIHFDGDPDLCCFDVHWKSGNIVWSSDSKFVAFLATVGELTDLYVLEVSTGDVRNLTDDGDFQVEEWITSY